MATADCLTIEGGTPGIDLMEAAGAAVATEILRRWQRRPVVVLCGPGNNGGDGFVVARILREFGWDARIARLDARAGAKGDAKIAAERWSGPELPFDAAQFDGQALIVDALFGAGLDRPLDGSAKSVLEALSAQKRDIVAIDVPSGVAGDTGAILGLAPNCRLTVTFFRPKPAHFIEPARSRCGTLVVVDIGIPKSILPAIAPTVALNGPEIWASLIPRPDISDHKYTRGHALIFGGTQMTGAARLAARAARRVGTGLLTIACSPEAASIYAIDQAGAIVKSVADTDAFAHLTTDPRVAAVLVGPGAGIVDATRSRALAPRASGKPTVLDADALSVFQSMPERLFDRLDATCLLTPHEGEFRRLFPDLSTEDALASGRLARARAAAVRANAILLFKGSDTVIAAPDGRAILSPFGPPTLATGGTGDVLAGIAVGLMAQGMGAFEAAAAACWLQAEAARGFGPGLIAEDLPERLPGVLATLFWS